MPGKNTEESIVSFVAGILKDRISALTIVNYSAPGFAPGCFIYDSKFITKIILYRERKFFCEHAIISGTKRQRVELYLYSLYSLSAPLRK